MLNLLNVHNGWKRFLLQEKLSDSCHSFDVDESKGENSSFAKLGNDIVIEILARIPAECIMSSCKLVCRHWYHLIKTGDFVNAHLKKTEYANIVIFHTNSTREDASGSTMFVVDQEERRGRSSIKLDKVLTSEPRFMLRSIPLQVIASCDGILVVRYFEGWPPGIYMLCNLMTKEAVKVRIPPTYNDANHEIIGDVIGLFLDQHRNEYSFIQRHIYDRKNGIRSCKYPYVYSLYGLKTKSCTTLSESRYGPYWAWNGSVNIGLNVCWMVGYRDYQMPQLIESCSACVMIFKGDSKTLHLLPHPKIDCRHGAHIFMRLFQVESHLGFFESRGSVVNIWTTQDFVKCCWVQRYSINTQAKIKYYPNIEWGFRSGTKIDVLGICRGELLLRNPRKGLFGYHLALKTLRKIKVDSSITSRWTKGFLYLLRYTPANGLIYRKTLISPKKIIG